MGKSRATTYLCIFLAAQTIGCGETKPPVKPDTDLAFDHGVVIGDRLLAVSLSCSDGRSREVAAANKIQLVTLWTADDCSSCSRHLAGLETAWHQAEIPFDQFVVTYATSARRPEVLRSHRAGSTRPLCIDTAAKFWDKYDIRHTPVTILIENGRVAYMHDLPLDSDEMRKEFVRKVVQIAKH